MMLCFYSKVVQSAEGPPPEEVIVTGRAPDRVLEKQIRAAEDRMYGLFNELNTDDQYDIHCRWRAPIGTRLRQRQCRPTFFDRATEDNAAAFLAQALGAHASGGPLDAVNAKLNHHYPILEEKLREATLQHPELFDAIQRHNALREELEARRKDSLSSEE